MPLEQIYKLLKLNKKNNVTIFRAFQNQTLNS